MIRLSRTARSQIADLVRHHEALERPEAIRNLRAALTRAAERIEQRRGSFMPAPRPYPRLQRPGWLWLKEPPYWIAHAADARGPVIRAIFHESADMPARLPED